MLKGKVIFFSLTEFIIDRKGAPFNSLWRKSFSFVTYFYRKTWYYYSRWNWNIFHVSPWGVNLLNLWHLINNEPKDISSKLHCKLVHSIIFINSMWMYKRLRMLIRKMNNGCSRLILLKFINTFTYECLCVCIATSGIGGGLP